MKPIRLAVFASGNGTNAEALMERFKDRPDIEVAYVLSNNAGAGVHERARRLGVPSHTLNRAEFDAVAPRLEADGIDMVVLAGFLLKVSDALLEAYPGRVVNLHPALLPAYGGKGMYGHHVHQAVLAAGERQSGITIHFVDGRYDHGEAIYQARCPVLLGDTPDTLAARIHTLEHLHLPRIVEQTALRLGKRG